MNNNDIIAVIGLGYVGLPIALEFANKTKVLGFDINSNKIKELKEARDSNGEVEQSEFENKNICFSDCINDLKEANIYIIAVPTPVTRFNVPDLKPLERASKLVAKVLSKGDIVIYESTVYPGCTEEDCIPILQDISGLKCPSDFKVGYSPERINPGDKVHTLTNTIKIVSGIDEDALNRIAKIYESVISAGVYMAKSIKVAEAAKIIENTQRDVNIALMNELSIIFDKVGVDTLDVLEAAGTKWNFLKFFPGLVGGHCIGVDPYYLTHKSIELGYIPEIILTGRKINDNLSRHVAKQAVLLISEQGIPVKNAKILVMGVTFKENVNDIRNSKVVDVVKELESYGIEVEVTDPYADGQELQNAYGISLIDQIGSSYHCIILAVKHHEYRDLNEEWFLKHSEGNGALIDIKSQFLNQISKMLYWTL